MRIVLEHQDTDNCTYWSDSTLFFVSESIEKAYCDIVDALILKHKDFLKNKDFVYNNSFRINDVDVALSNLWNPSTNEPCFELTTLEDYIKDIKKTSTIMKIE
jgi:hypothetical protein